MKDLQQQRPKLKYQRLYLTVMALIIFLIPGIIGISKFIDWNEKHYLVKQDPITLKVQAPIVVREREEPKVVEKQITPATLEEVDTPIKKYACDKWLKETGTDAYCLIMIAIFQAESGWNNQAWGYNPPTENKGKSLDYGVAQINSLWWDEKGCSMIDIVIEAKNIDCAYMIWDRADGEEGNGKGNFNPWMAFVNDKHLAHLDK